MGLNNIDNFSLFIALTNQVKNNSIVNDNSHIRIHIRTFENNIWYGNIYGWQFGKIIEYFGRDLAYIYYFFNWNLFLF